MMSKEIWNNRFKSEQYIYGTEPNAFVKEKLRNISKGKILFPAEGEGRNAVFAAKTGFQVTAFDQSETAQVKALKLAHKEKVNINYQVNTIENIHFEEAYFDCIVLVYAHFVSDERKKNHEKLLRFLKPGGKIILEGFAKEQINYNSGGPKIQEMLFSEEELRDDFSLLNINELRKERINLNEGELHNGEAMVIRLIATK